MRSIGPLSFRRFLQHSKDYIDCVAKEAGYRERGQVLDLESFKHLRRENSAIRLCFGLFEFTLGIDLPDAVFTDPVFKRMYWAAADMVCWANVSTAAMPSCLVLTILFSLQPNLIGMTGRVLVRYGASEGSLGE